MWNRFIFDQVQKQSADGASKSKGQAFNGVDTQELVDGQTNSSSSAEESASAEEDADMNAHN